MIHFVLTQEQGEKLSRILHGQERVEVILRPKDLQELTDTVDKTLERKSPFSSDLIKKMDEYWQTLAGIKKFQEL